MSLRALSGRVGHCIIRPVSEQDKALYHQIHPIKLITDWGTGVLALYFFWQHMLAVALAIAILPSVVVSFALIRFADLNLYRESGFGNYVHQYMTRAMEALRFGGYAVMAIGAWLHAAWFIFTGLLIILFAWTRGLIFPDRRRN